MTEGFVLEGRQVAAIHQALAEADAGDLATDEEVEPMVSEWLGAPNKPACDPSSAGFSRCS